MEASDFSRGRKAKPCVCSTRTGMAL